MVGFADFADIVVAAADLAAGTAVADIAADTLAYIAVGIAVDSPCLLAADLIGQRLRILADEIGNKIDMPREIGIRPDHRESYRP